MKYILIVAFLIPFFAFAQTSIGNPRETFFALNDTYTAPVIWDTSAQRFFDSTGITNITQKNAVNQMAKSLKDSSLWTGIAALYPIVGGTSATHSYNLKNTAAYKLTYVGAATHDANGIVFGSAKYAKTGLAPSVEWSLNSGGASFYTTSTAVDGGTVFGSVGASADSRFFYFPYFSGAGGYQLNINSNSALSATGAAVPNGFHSVNRISSSTINIYKNGAIAFTSGVNTSNTLSDKEIHINGYNNNGTSSSTSSFNFRLVTIKNRFFTVTEERMLYNIVLAYQTALSRN